MRLKFFALLVAALFALGQIGTVFADTTGYEGQPGNQSSGSGSNGNGPSGFEGQPGGQGGGN